MPRRRLPFSLSAAAAATLGCGLAATGALYGAVSRVGDGSLGAGIGFGGLALTLAAAAGAHSLSSRAARLQRMLDQRSAELALANDSIAADAVERSAREQRIHHIAQHDVLTGLPGRSLLQDSLAQAIVASDRGGGPLWVMLIDLDRFKYVNDSMGHRAGDMLLMTVAARLRSALSDSDTVARLSSDEFVAIVSAHPGAPLLPALVQGLMDAVAQPVWLGAREHSVTCSIGVAVYPAPDTPADSLIEHADIAMYSAKKLGRNNFQFYTPAMNEEAQERMRIEGWLRKALERDEFVLHYQPQVDIASGKVVGMEALIRWKHPELGMVAPGRFIGVAEDTGLIVPIGAWVMRTACAQNRAWQDAGLGKLRVAVNLSARQFGSPDLLGDIARVLAETGISPECLEIELTESLFMS
ncbi:putative bifunctional diguanylate cyclase/phosphodiesterase, partial [Massilia cavernae]